MVRARIPVRNKRDTYPRTHTCGHVPFAVCIPRRSPAQTATKPGFQTSREFASGTRARGFQIELSRKEGKGADAHRMHRSSPGRGASRPLHARRRLRPGELWRDPHRAPSFPPAYLRAVRGARWTSPPGRGRSRTPCPRLQHRMNALCLPGPAAPRSQHTRGRACDYRDLPRAHFVLIRCASRWRCS